MAITPRIALEDPMMIVNLPVHAEGITLTTTIEVGDLLRYQTEATATAAGVALFDTATEDDLFLGVAKGKTKTDMVSGAYGDHIPVATKCIVEIDLTSGNYNFGEYLGWVSKNVLALAVTSTHPTLAWFWESDQDSLTRGLVMIDIYVLGNLFAILTLE